MAGVPLDASGHYAGNVGDLFSPFTVAAGIDVVALFAFHGATFLTLRTTGPLCERAARTARRLAIPVLAAGTALLAWIVVMAVDRNEKDLRPAAVPAAVGAVALVAATALVWRRASGWAFAMTAAATAALVATIFTSLYPRVLVSHPTFANSLTVDGAASQPYTLKVLTVVAVFLIPAFALYQGWAYYVLRGRLGVQTAESRPRGRSPA